MEKRLKPLLAEKAVMIPVIRRDEIRIGRKMRRILVRIVMMFIKYYKTCAAKFLKKNCGFHYNSNRQ
jgi:hypothetical protein